MQLVKKYFGGFEANIFIYMLLVFFARPDETLAQKRLTVGFEPTTYEFAVCPVISNFSYAKEISQKFQHLLGGKFFDSCQ